MSNTDCSTCYGFPHPSGRVCICGGANTRRAEVDGLRLCIFELETECARLTAIVDALTVECVTCGGSGGVKVEVTRSEHGCDGTEVSCLANCPIPVSDFEIAPCSDCNGIGRVARKDG